MGLGLWRVHIPLLELASTCGTLPSSLGLSVEPAAPGRPEVSLGHVGWSTGAEAPPPAGELAGRPSECHQRGLAGS